MKALLLIDIQNDFLPGGALAVPDGNAVIPVANAMMKEFDFVVATQDWHPDDHGSFASQHDSKAIGDVTELEGLEQVLWPDHCVQDNFGAQLPEGLNAAGIDVIVRKGVERNVDSYSAFYDNGRRSQTELDEILRAKGVTELHVMGLATDYCVKFTALDAAELGYDVRLIPDGCRGVNLNPGDVDRAIEEMRAAGVDAVTATGGATCCD